MYFSNYIIVGIFITHFAIVILLTPWEQEIDNVLYLNVYIKKNILVYFF